MFIVTGGNAVPSGIGPAPELAALGLIFSRIVNAILGLSAIALFVMLILAGFKYLTSGGDPKAVEGAKNTLTYAIFGMVAIVLSFLVLKLIENLTGAKVTQFNIRVP